MFEIAIAETRITVPLADGQVLRIYPGALFVVDIQNDRAYLMGIAFSVRPEEYRVLDDYAAVAVERAYTA